MLNYPSKSKGPCVAKGNGYIARMLALVAGAAFACGNVHALDPALLKNVEQKRDREFKARMQEGLGSQAEPDKLNAALLQASFQGFPESVDWLLGAGATPRFSDKNGFTALMTVFLNAKYLPTEYQIASLFLQKGADANALNANGANALWLFVNSRVKVEGMQIGDDICRPGGALGGSTIVPWKNEDALREYERATLRLLLKATKHPEVRPRPVPSPLLMAFEKRRFDLAAELLGAGADARVIDGDGRTLLHYATPDLVAPLVEAGVDPNRRDRFGNTALHRAVLGFSRPPAELRAYVEAMVRSGAKDVRGERGQYAADIVSPVSRCKEEAADAWPAIQALLRSARE